MIYTIEFEHDYGIAFIEITAESKQAAVNQFVSRYPEHEGTDGTIEDSEGKQSPLAFYWPNRL
jgi:hypothetical protein